jgi:UDP-N-acetyl-D-glucosamine:ribostamycin N-acetyl-D-glucosaminyltransferase
MPEPLKVLFEMYDEGFEATATWGGVETALWFLTGALRLQGIQVDFYRPADGSLDALAERVSREGVDAVVPLVESELFTARQWRRWPHLHSRVVRIWHDVSLLATDLTTPAPCPVHGAPVPSDGTTGRAGPCTAAPAHPEGPMVNVFLRESPWTGCFPRRHYVAWATDHLPGTDLRDRDGPIVLQLGKTDNDAAERSVQRLLAAGRSLRLIFANWSRLGRQARVRFRRYATDPAVTVIEAYDIRADWAAVFGGASYLLVPSRFHETFNFLAAEAVQLGIPVLSLGNAGSLSYFATQELGTIDDAVDLLLGVDAPALTPRARPELGWAEVARAYSDIIAGLRESPRERAVAH